MILHLAKCKGGRGSGQGAFQNTGAISSHHCPPARKSHTKMDLFILSRPRPRRSLTTTCPFLRSLSALFIMEQDPLKSKASIPSGQGAQNCSISFQTLTAGQSSPEPIVKRKRLHGLLPSEILVESRPRKNTSTLGNVGAELRWRKPRLWEHT